MYLIPNNVSKKSMLLFIYAASAAAHCCIMQKHFENLNAFTYMQPLPLDIVATYD